MGWSLRVALFKSQFLTALALIVFATQKDTAEWVAIGTTYALAAWCILSLVLLVACEEYLIRAFPWSLIAIALPTTFWLLVSFAIRLDISYAGLLIPFWISTGLICLTISDRVDTASTGLPIRDNDPRDLEMGLQAARSIRA